MFDTNRVAKNIRTARTKMNMTQMNLADEMGVSYQAVSNWERGNSMPDISKLPELCKILDISFEELVGEKGAETDVAKKLMQDEEVSLEEIAQMGPLVKPDKLEKKVYDTIEKKEKISFSTLVGLAPFVDKETLGKMAEELADVDFRKLAALAPFVAGETLDKIVDKSIRNERIDTNDVMAIAPFISGEMIRKVADYLVEHGQSGKLPAIAPFMSKEMLGSLLKNVHFDRNDEHESGRNSGDSELENLDEDEVAELAFRALEKEEPVDRYLDYMCEDDVARLAFKALENGRDVAIYLDYMCEDDVARLASKALENGRDVAIYLDYMCEDDVARLASEALENGSDIEAYLDYMDEDSIKQLLLRASKMKAKGQDASSGMV